MDLAVKWRFFKHLSGGDDPESEHVYRLHIEARSGARMEAGFVTDQWKTETDDYVSSATGLFESMSSGGFKATCAVPIDRKGELLGGAHRVACALSLGIPQIMCEIFIDRDVVKEKFPPPWDYFWFTENMPKTGNKKILKDWLELNGQYT